MYKKIIILIIIILLSVISSRRIEHFLPIYMMWYSEWMRLYMTWMKAMTGNLYQKDGSPMLDPFTGLPLI